MKTKRSLGLALLLILVMQAACTPQASPTRPAEACPTATADLKLLTDAQAGYCLLYPAAYSTDISNLIVINPVQDPGDVPGEAWVYVNVVPAEGRTTAQVADEAITALVGDFNITKTDIVVDGASGVVVDGMPGQDSNRQLLIVHNDKLYVFTFQPWYPSADGSTPLEGLYTTIVQTLHFLL
jgi:hypothetical protein